MQEALAALRLVSHLVDSNVTAQSWSSRRGKNWSREEERNCGLGMPTWLRLGMLQRAERDSTSLPGMSEMCRSLQEIQSPILSRGTFCCADGDIFSQMFAMSGGGREVGGVGCILGYKQLGNVILSWDGNSQAWCFLLGPVLLSETDAELLTTICSVFGALS